jgi:rfaE bifunctional protein kinase chain/domain
MTLSLPATRLVEQFAWARVLVVGDVLLDEWVAGSARTLAREAPVPTVSVGYRECVPGGAGNTALNAVGLGGRVKVLTALGGDDAATTIRDEFARRGVEALCITVPGRRTVTKRRIVADRHVLARVDDGDAAPLPAEADEWIAQAVREHSRTVDAVLVADYGAGVCAGQAVRGAVAEICRDKPVLIDSHDLRSWSGVKPAMVTPNWGEAALLLDSSVEAAGVGRVKHVIRQAPSLRAATGSAATVVTLDADGAVLIDAQGAHHVPARTVDEAHSAGAGDTVSAALALGLALNADRRVALEVAVTAATVVVSLDPPVILVGGSAR